MRRSRLVPLLAALVITLVGWYAVRSWAERAAGPSGGPESTSPRATPADKDDAMKPKYSRSGYDITPLDRAQVAKLAARLDPEAYRITQKAGTEPAFCGNLVDNKKDGAYVCVVCGLPLFASEHKFHSGTGWPSFYRELDPEHVSRRTDSSLGLARTEVTCVRCGAHLGHVFEDGPPPTGLRFCLNSASLRFFAKDATLPAESLPVKPEVAYFAGGCFWGVEHYFDQGPGVVDATSGYMQGRLDHPTYEQVCTGSTGHAETVKVLFDPQRITYRRLLEAFFKMHDPSQRDRQGPDVGSQYRSGIWYVSEKQRQEAEDYVKELEAQKSFGGRRVVTQVEPARTFWPAEQYHQDYIATTGRACHVTNPW